MSNNKMVGNHIKTLREKKNCSQDILTKMTGVAVSTKCMYETCERSPHDEIKVKIANALDKNLKYLKYIFLENDITNCDKTS